MTGFLWPLKRPRPPFRVDPRELPCAAISMIAAMSGTSLSPIERTLGCDTRTSFINMLRAFGQKSLLEFWYAYFLHGSVVVSTSKCDFGTNNSPSVPHPYTFPFPKTKVSDLQHVNELFLGKKKFHCRQMSENLRLFFGKTSRLRQCYLECEVVSLQP